MHPKDYALILFGAALVAVWLGLCGLKQKWSWWKDAFQVAGVLAAVAIIVGVVSPVKPKSEADIAREAAEFAEQAQALQKKQDDRAMLDAMVACQYAIQAQLEYPSSFSHTYISDWNRQITTRNGWEIFHAFTAQNGLGFSLPHVGHCTVTRGGDVTVEIKRS